MSECKFSMDVLIEPEEHSQPLSCAINAQAIEAVRMVLGELC